MNNPFDQLRDALNAARELDRATEQYANNMADLLAGKLRKVSAYRLAKLKKELRDFNIHTGTWKE